MYFGFMFLFLMYKISLQQTTLHRILPKTVYILNINQRLSTCIKIFKNTTAFLLVFLKFLFIKAKDYKSLPVAGGSLMVREEVSTWHFLLQLFRTASSTSSTARVPRTLSLWPRLSLLGSSTNLFCKAAMFVISTTTVWRNAVNLYLQIVNKNMKQMFT